MTQDGGATVLDILFPNPWSLNEREELRPHLRLFPMQLSLYETHRCKLEAVRSDRSPSQLKALYTSMTQHFTHIQCSTILIFQHASPRPLNSHLISSRGFRWPLTRKVLYVKLITRMVVLWSLTTITLHER